MNQELTCLEANSLMGTHKHIHMYNELEKSSCTHVHKHPCTLRIIILNKKKKQNNRARGFSNNLYPELM